MKYQFERQMKFVPENRNNYQIKHNRWFEPRNMVHGNVVFEELSEQQTDKRKPYWNSDNWINKIPFRTIGDDIQL